MTCENRIELNRLTQDAELVDEVVRSFQHRDPRLHAYASEDQIRIHKEITERLRKCMDCKEEYRVIK